MNEPLVSVVMISYGHEKYIQQAIESILIQQCNFEIELIISNDCSPDNTDAVINDIIRNHPKSNLIQYHNHIKNIGMLNNFVFAMQQAKGTYIAICEGDDYWNDSLKLQKQVEFLESNKEIVFCFHNANRLDEKTTEFFPYIGLETFKNKEIVPKNKLFLRAGGTYPTASAFFRKCIIEKLPSYFYSFGVGDTPLLLHALTQGEIGYLSDVMCVYRTTETNWSSHNTVFANKLKNYNIKIKAYEEFDRATHQQYKVSLKNTISHLTYQVVYAYCQEEKGISNLLKFYFKYQFRMNSKQNLKSIFRIINS